MGFSTAVQSSDVAAAESRHDAMSEQAWRELGTGQADETSAGCVNCGTTLRGDFCWQCGQRQRKQRLSLRGLLQHVLDHAFSLDRGLLHTAIALTRRPANVLADYLRGKTVPYTSPVRYFLIWVSIAQILAVRFGAFDAFAEGFETGAGLTESGFRATVASLVGKYYVLTAAGSVPLAALASRLLMRRSGLVYAEHLVVHLYAMGHTALVSCLALPMGNADHPVTFAAVLVLNLLALSLYVWVPARLLGSTLLRGVGGMALSMLLSWFLYLVLIVLFFFQRLT